MRSGTYMDKNNKPVQVSRTPSGGYIVKDSTGKTTVIGGK